MRTFILFDYRCVVSSLSFSLRLFVCVCALCCHFALVCFICFIRFSLAINNMQLLCTFFRVHCSKMIALRIVWSECGFWTTWIVIDAIEKLKLYPLPSAYIRLCVLWYAVCWLWESLSRSMCVFIYCIGHRIYLLSVVCSPFYSVSVCVCRFSGLYSHSVRLHLVLSFKSNSASVVFVELFLLLLSLLLFL